MYLVIQNLYGEVVLPSEQIVKITRTENKIYIYHNDLSITTKESFIEEIELIYIDTEKAKKEMTALLSAMKENQKVFEFDADF